jgi:sterol desaturase/sphingolipid hydroxylase (fatty acid hydroxylase superfamily)
MTLDFVPYVLPFFIMSLTIELLLWKFWKRGHYEARDTATSLLLGVGETIVHTMGSAVIIYTVYKFVEMFQIWSIPTNLMTVLICFIFCDFAYYWSHRWSHEKRWMWASHVVHHSSQYFNLATALRSSWTDVLSLSFLPWVAVILMGFSADLVFTIRALALIYGFWLHFHAITNLGLLERVLMTPQHHKIHHARNPCYLDRNYGGVLLVWDKIFGTYVSERLDETPRFGIVHSVATFNPFVLAFHEWVCMLRDAAGARSLRELWFFLLGPPGWRRDGHHETSKAIREADAERRMIRSTGTHER